MLDWIWNEAGASNPAETETRRRPGSDNGTSTSWRPAPIGCSSSSVPLTCSTAISPKSVPSTVSRIGWSTADCVSHVRICPAPRSAATLSAEGPGTTIWAAAACGRGTRSTAETKVPSAASAVLAKPITCPVASTSTSPAWSSTVRTSAPIRVRLAALHCTRLDSSPPAKMGSIVALLAKPSA